MEYKENEMYREIGLWKDGVQIGEAEIELGEKMLSRLYIYEGYQGKGYGTEVVKELSDKYGLDVLWVKAENKRAIRVYEKCGYEISEPGMWIMRRKKDEDRKNN